jgi:hypothetical protein
VLKNSDSRLFKKVSDARRTRNRSFDFAQDRLEAYLQYVVTRRLSATKQVSLFQQPVRI